MKLRLGFPGGTVEIQRKWLTDISWEIISWDNPPRRRQKNIGEPTMRIADELINAILVFASAPSTKNAGALAGILMPLSLDRCERDGLKVPGPIPESNNRDNPPHVCEEKSNDVPHLRTPFGYRSVSFETQ